jgi:hypothetical protein
VLPQTVVELAVVPLGNQVEERLVLLGFSTTSETTGRPSSVVL